MDSRKLWMLGMLLVMGMACEGGRITLAPSLGAQGPCPNHENLQLGQHKDCPILVSQSNILDFNTYANTEQGLTRHYRLVEDVVLSGSNNWKAIGRHRPYAPFTGSFDGDGHTLRNLSIETDDSYQGMFGYIGADAVIEKLTLENVNVNVNDDNFAGGLAGYNKGTVQHCHATGNVNGGWFVGGLVGHNAGTVQHSHSAGSVGVNGDYIGGLVGDNYGMVDNSHSNSSVSGKQNVGGLVGSGPGTVQNSYATGDVSGNISVGGLVGSSGVVQNSYATGNVSGNSFVGGLVGHNDGTVQSCYATGSVTGSDRTNSIGGLVGYNFEGTVQNSMTLGFRVSGPISVGRVVGMNVRGTLVNNFAFAGMLHGEGNTHWEYTVANDIGGEGRTAEQLKTRGGFPAELSSPPWTYEEGCLPGLGHTVPMPDYIANGK